MSIIIYKWNLNQKNQDHQLYEKEKRRIPIQGNTYINTINTRKTSKKPEENI